MDEIFDYPEEIGFGINFNDMKIKIKSEIKKIKKLDNQSDELKEIVKNLENIIN